MIITIEGFGKISYARFNLGDYNIFVGENNSGKTYAMQLIYGIIDFFTSRIGFINYNKDITDLFNNLPIEINKSNYQIIETYINELLDQKKNEIVNYIFKKEISIKRIQVSFNDFNSIYTIKNTDPSEIYEDYLGVDEKEAEKFTGFSHFQISSNQKTIARFGMISDFSQQSKRYISEIIRIILCDYLQIKSLSRSSDNIFYLPASRSGLMLLYRHYFEKNNNDVNVIDSARRDSYLENEYGLTQPVYDFISFLQTYELSDRNTKKNEKIINFINSNLINGSLKRTGNSMLYVPNNSDLVVPAYLSSSMINEISPVMQLLTSINNFKYVFYDEIETCQHPLTQIQMARLLVRMVNFGYKMIVSTHSDTMAAAINNLVMLSFVSNREEKAAKLNYTSEDFLRTQSIHAYQFINTENGTVVEEIENCLGIGIGFNFSSFGESNKKIYNDAQIILEDT